MTHREGRTHPATPANNDNLTKMPRYLETEIGIGEGRTKTGCTKSHDTHEEEDAFKIKQEAGHQHIELQKGAKE